jgi:predicted ABC-type ATPase
LPTQIAERPIFWIIAGPNGSGKSRLYQNVEFVDVSGFGRAVWIINPDLLAQRLQSVEALAPDEANLEAVRRIETWLEASIKAHHTVGVETVLSTDKYRRLVSEAKSRRYEFRLIYVLLDDVERNIERVRLRVRMGGHDVPEAKIRERRERSLRQLPWFLAQADQAFIYDNSGSNPQLIARKAGDVITRDPQLLPEIVTAIDAVVDR